MVYHRDFHFTFMILCVDKLWIANFHEGKKPFQWEDCLFSFPKKLDWIDISQLMKEINLFNAEYVYQISKKKKVLENMTARIGKI